MALRAFKDDGDGYYQVDIPDGEQPPKWTEGMTETEVLFPDPSPEVSS